MKGRRVLGWVGACLATTIIVLALLVSTLRIIVPQVPEYRGEVAAWAGDLLGAPVDIDTMGLQWRWLRPELILGDVRYVSAHARHAFAAREVRVGISVRALLRGRLAPARIVLVEPDITLDFEAVDDGEGWRRTFAARAHRGEVRIERGSVTLLAEEGRRRLDFRMVDAEISSDGVHHELTVSAQPARVSGGSFDASLDARSWPGQRDWLLAGDIVLRGIDLVGLQRIGRRGRLQSGIVDLTVALNLSHSGAQHISFDLGLSGVRWPAIDGTPLGVDRAAAEATLTLRDGSWVFAMHRLVAARGDGVRESGPIMITHTPTRDDAAARWFTTAGAVYLDDIVLLAEALPWEPVAGIDDMLVRNPRGLLQRVEVDARTGAGAGIRYSLAVGAEGLGLDPAPGGIPGFERVAATVAATHERGSVHLTVADGGVEFPALHRGAIPLHHLLAEVAWEQDGDGGWVFAAPRLEIMNADIVTQGDGRLTWPTEGPPSLDLSMTYSDVSLAAHGPYLPVSVMSENLVAWLDAAVLGGHARAGTFRYSGEPSGDALRNGRATLEAEFDADNIALRFAENWPTFVDGRAQVRFTGTGFAGTVSGGRLGNVEVPSADVSIDSFAHRVLEIDGTTAGRIAPMLDTVRTTPVGGAAWLAGVQADGAAQVALTLKLPLGIGQRAEVRGEVLLGDATLSFHGFPHPMTEIHGVLVFTEDGVATERVDGTLLGFPAHAKVDTLRDRSGVARAVEVTLDGSLDRDGVAALLDYAAPPVTGRTRWQARILAPFADGHAPYLEVDTTLEGLAVALPQPLGKAAADSRTLTIRAELLDNTRRFTVDGGVALRAAGAFVAGDARWRFAQGRIRIGDGELPDAPEHGIALSGRLAEWSHGVSDGLPVMGADLPITAIDLHIDAFEVYGRPLSAVRMQGQRESAAWAWSFDGDRLAGTLVVPDTPANDTPVIVDFGRLNLPPRSANETVVQPQRDLDARAMVPLLFHIGHFTFGVAELGELNGVVRQVENGVTLEGFSATRPDLRIAGDATWHTVDGFHRTTLRTTVDSTDVRRALAALGYGDSVEASAGHLQAELNWLGSPLADPLALLNGSVQVRIERGILYELQPGAGRVFGLLSLNALPRRLALDFSDVYRRGLAFDSISGSFHITDGHAHTDDLRLQGPAARVEIRGRTGLATRDYDQEAVVVASLASSLAIAGTLAGGPGVGAAMLIASGLLKGPLEGISRARYRVTGSWEQPSVERIVEPVRGPQ